MQLLCYISQQFLVVGSTATIHYMMKLSNQLAQCLAKDFDNTGIIHDEI